jgi:hypothetical protein
MQQDSKILPKLIDPLKRGYNTYFFIAEGVAYKRETTLP